MGRSRYSLCGELVSPPPPAPPRHVPDGQLLTPAAITIPSPNLGPPPGSLPGGSRPPQIAPLRLASSALKCILCSNSPRSEKRGGQPSPVLGADLAARRGCRITQGRNAAWSLSGWCLMYTGLLRKLNVWAQLLSSPPHGPRPRKMPLAKGTHSR